MNEDGHMKHMHCKPATLEARKDAKIVKKGAEKKRKSSPPQASPPARLTGTFLALEPRILFDGAALATGAEVVQDTATQDQPGIPEVKDETSTDSNANDSSDNDALWSSGLSLSASSDRKEIVFIDTRVENYQTLMDGIDPAAEVILLDARRDGIEQIAEALKGRSDIDAIHLIGEGTEAELHLGTAFLTNDSISGHYAELFGQIGQSLSAEADLLIYGCNFGRGTSGLSAIQTLADLTGADIAASTDRTGHVSEYSNWQLEVSTGFIETSIVIGQATQDAWEGVLATYTVTNINDAGAGSFRQAIIDANTNGGADTITFSIAGAGPHTITLLSALDPITGAVLIDGWSEPDFAGTPIIELDGTSAGAGVNGLVIGATGGGSTLRGLAIQNFNHNGILVQSANNTIAGNYIGLDADGTTVAGNNQSGASYQGGIRIESANNTIGGLTAGDRNVISGNSFAGIELYSASAMGNQVLGNYIGTDAGGTLDRGNSQEGIDFEGGSSNTIGGAAAGARNVISGNDSDGLEIDHGDFNIVQGNYIGTDFTGTLDLGNARDGIDINEDSGNGAIGNLIGGTGANEGNLIFGNDLHGIDVRDAPTTGNAILGNQIYGNTLRGINLEGGTEDGFGVTANDAGDGDAGANNLQNFPVVTSADVDSPTQITIEGTFNSTASTTFRIEFYKNTVATGQDLSSHGEGQTYLGFMSVTTDGSGNGSFNVTLTASVTAGEFVTATATRDLGGGNYGSTSEFALNATAAAVNDAPVAADDRPGLTFDGVDDFVQVGNDVSLEMTSTMTMEVWFQTISFSNTRQIILNREGEYEVGIFPDGTIRWAFANTDPGWGWFDTGHVVQLNEWTHVAVTFDNGTINTYVNGSLIHTYNGSGAIGDGHVALDDFRIGGRSNSPAGQYFEGSVGEVRIWNTVRTAGEISTNYDQLLTGNESGLVGNWRLREGSGTSVTDLSSSGNNGTLGGGTPSQEPTWVGYSTDQDNILNIAASGVLVNDVDAESDTLVVSEINGSAPNVGNPVALASGALVTLNVNGSFAYDPNGQFDSLTAGEQASDQFSYTADDGNGGTDNATVYVTINGVNDLPVIANLGGDTLAYTEGDGASVIDQSGNAAVSDVDSANFDTGTLTVSFTAGSDAAEDVLAIRDQGAGPTNITVAGSAVSYGGTQIGTVAGGTAGANLVITLDANADAAAVSALVQNITYTNTDTDNPTLGSRTVRYVLTDGDGGTSANYDTTVTFAAVNDVPLNTVPGTQTVNEETQTAIAGISVIDVDAAAGTITTRLQVTAGVLDVTLSGAATISAGANSSNDLTILGTVADVNATLASLLYTGNTDVTGVAADTVTVTTDDGGNTGTGGAQQDVDNIQIDITAVNDSPVITSNGGGATAVVNSAENQTGVTTVTATDVDVPADTLTYTITGGADAARFSLDPTSGVLTFIVAPDFDAPTDAGTNNVYDVVVQVSDGNGGADTQAIAVTVTDGNDAPVIVSNGGGATAAFSMGENNTGVTTVTATDVDVPADTLTYTITGGADAARFSLDPTSGVLTFIVPPDFETPTDADANNIYEVVVQVSDGNGGVDSQMIQVTVTDVQEGISQPPTPQPGPTPTPAPSPRPTPESPLDTTTSPTGTPQIEFPGPFGGQQSPPGRDLSRHPHLHSIPDWNRVLEVAPFLRPAAFGITSEQIRAYAPAPVLLSSIELSQEFLQQLNSFSDDLEETTQQTIDERSFFIKMMEYTGLGVSGVLLAWLVRSGTLMASMLAALPTWRSFDPIAILDMDQKSRENLTKKMKEAAEKETREHQGLDRMLDQKIVKSFPPSSTFPSGSS